MKILYVDMQFNYGKERDGINQIGEIGFNRVFKKLGHDVVPFYYDEYFNTNAMEKLQTDLLQFADAQKPELIYFCLYTDQFKPETLLALKAKYRTINWFGDDQWRFENFSSKYAPLFTYAITTDPFAVPKYKKAGIENVILSQWAALNIDSPTENSIGYDFEVSFVGGANSVRKWFISEFLKAGIEVATFGNNWPNGPVSLERMQEIFRKSKINLNLSNSTNLDVRYLTHNLRNIVTAIRNPKNISQMKARNFEIPYFGGFQLTDYLPTLENYFDIGREVVCYANVNEAIQLTKFYLENAELRESIKAASIKKTYAEHTYLHRLQEIFSHL